MPGPGHPSVFKHVDRGLCVLVHGDVYFTSGNPDQLDWLENGLGEKYEIRTQRIGNGQGRECEGKILNRIVRWTRNGYELEAEPRHAELIIKPLGTLVSKKTTKQTPS